MSGEKNLPTYCTAKLLASEYPCFGLWSCTFRCTYTPVSSFHEMLNSSLNSSCRCKQRDDKFLDGREFKIQPNSFPEPIFASRTGTGFPTSNFLAERNHISSSRCNRHGSEWRYRLVLPLEVAYRDVTFFVSNEVVTFDSGISWGKSHVDPFLARMC